MLRSFPRKRESRAKHAGSSMALWVPAFAGMSGIEPPHASFEKLLHVPLVDQNRVGKQIRPAGDRFLRLLLNDDRLDRVDRLPAHILERDRDRGEESRIRIRDTRVGLGATI